MSYGIEFKNDAGSRVISEAMKNMHYIGTASNTYNQMTMLAYGGAQYSSLKNVMRHGFSISSTERPMCFIKGSSGSYYAQSAMSASGSTWSFEVVSYPTSTPTVLCFAPLPAGSGLVNPNDFGVAVYDSAGNVVFDANRKHLDPAYFNTVSMPSCGPHAPNGNGHCANSTSISTGIAVSQPAFFFASRGRAFVPGDNNKLFHMHTLNMNSNGTTATVAWSGYHNENGIYSGFVETGIEATPLIIIDAARYL